MEKRKMRVFREGCWAAGKVWWVRSNRLNFIAGSVMRRRLRIRQTWRQMLIPKNCWSPCPTMIADY